MEREKDEVEIRGDSKGRREEGDESMSRIWKDKNRGATVNLG